MRTPIGRTATRIHLVTMLIVAITGIGLLAMAVDATFLSDDQYSRDMGWFVLLLMSPLWILGLAAGVDALGVARRQPVGRARAVIWALVLLLGGAYVAITGGGFHALLMLVLEPGRVHLAWPVLAVPVGDSGAQYFYLDSPTTWGPFVAALLGATSLIAVGLDRPRQRSDLGLSAGGRSAELA